MSEPEHDPRVDDLRQRLRALGYLDAGVDRFVLGPARASRAPSLIALFASLRIGGLAAILLGPAAAIGLTARLPGLVTGPRDAAIVAVYFAVFFGVAVAATAFVLSLAVSWMARRAGASFTRRAPLLSRIAGVFVTLGCLAYLTLWWQTVIAGVGWSAPVWTASALAIAAGISVLLGHAVTVGSSAVVMAYTHGATLAPVMRAPSPQTSRLARGRAWIGVGLVAFGSAALLLTWSSGTSRLATTPPPTLTVVPSGAKIRVIAIDGFDARIFEELSAAGRVPALASVFEGSIVRLDASSRETIDPARAWTTVATGQPPEVHGVRGLETRRVAGVQGSVPADEASPLARAIRGATDLVRLTRPSIASGHERRAKTFWEVAADAGLRTVVVNWWATWPVAGEGGRVLSDRATLRLEHGGTLDAEIAPATLYDSLRTRWSGLKSQATSRVEGAMMFDGERGSQEVIKRSAELDAMQLVLLSDITTSDTDLAVVYLPGLDIAQHALLGADASSGDQPRAAASTLAERLDSVKRYYVVLDRLVASAMKPGSDEIVMVITEPGRVAAAAGARLAVRGEGLRSGGALAGAETDIAPTILYALGAPIGRDLAGKPLVNLFAQGFLDRYPVRYVSTYGPPITRSAASSGQPLDQEMIDRLRSLGYVR